MKADFKAEEEAKKNRVQTQNEKDGKYTSSQLIARFFKRPTPEAKALGEAALRYEKMVHTAEKKLSEIKCKSTASSHTEQCCSKGPIVG